MSLTAKCDYVYDNRHSSTIHLSRSFLPYPQTNTLLKNRDTYRYFRNKTIGTNNLHHLYTIIIYFQPPPILKQIAWYMLVSTPNMISLSLSLSLSLSHKLLINYFKVLEHMQCTRMLKFKMPSGRSNHMSSFDLLCSWCTCLSSLTTLVLLVFLHLPVGLAGDLNYSSSTRTITSYKHCPPHPIVSLINY